MNEVLSIIGPVFGLAAIGYISARLGWVSEQMASGLALFVFNFAIPIFLVRVFANTDMPDTLPLGLWASFYLPQLTVYGIGMLAGRRFGRDFMGQTITGFGCAFGNTVLMGTAIVLLAFGDAGAVPLFLIISIHGLLLFTLTTVLLEFGRNQGASMRTLPLQIGKSLVTNPILIGIVTGLTLNVTEIQLPSVLDQIAAYMQDAVTPCAIFSLGVSLTRYGFVGRLGQTAFVTAMKLLVMPAGVWLFAQFVFELPPLWTMVAVLTAAQPCGVNLYLFAQRYRTAPALATSSVFLSTVISMATLSLLIYFVRVYGGVLPTG